MSWSQGDQDRRLHSLIRVGTVLEVDPETAKARVTFGVETKSAWIPWTGRAGVIDEWSPPVEGEQVLVVAPGGDTAQGLIVSSTPSNTYGKKSQDGEEYRITIGGSFFSMTSDRILLSSNGSTLEMDAAGIRLNGARIDLN